MRIVLLGAPGSGKGTQAALMVERLGLPHISTGMLLRNAAKRGTKPGLKAKAITDKGELVPDDIMSDILAERLSRDDVKNGFILDGYPRNLAQARSLNAVLEQLGTPVDEVLQIDVEPEFLIARIAKRAKEQDRTDDNEQVVRNRMRVYYQQTAPVIDYYHERGMLTYVLGDGPMEIVLERMLSVLHVNQTAS